MSSQLTLFVRCIDRFAANFHLGSPLPNELAEMIASYIPHCDLHSRLWTAGYDDVLAKSRTRDYTRSCSSAMDAKSCLEECSNSDYLSDILLDPQKALEKEHTVDTRDGKGIIENETDDGIHERVLMEGHTNSYSSPKWLNDVLYTPNGRQSSWITLARCGLRKNEPCRDLMIRFAGFGSANGGAGVR